VVSAAGGGTQEVEELFRFSETPKKLELLCSSKIYFTFLSCNILDHSTPRERSLTGLVFQSGLAKAWVR